MDKLNIMIAVMKLNEELYNDREIGYISVCHVMGISYIQLTEQYFRSLFTDYQIDKNGRLVAEYNGAKFVAVQENMT